MGLEWKRKSGNIVYQGSSGDIQFGQFSSATGGYGLQVKTTRTAIHRVYADDAGAVITSGTYRAGIFRTLLTAAHTAIGTVCGLQAQIKSVASITVDWAVGLWGYAEMASSKTVTGVLAGVRATVDIPTGSVIAAASRAAALVLDSINLGGTHTGDAVCIYVPNPGAGSWDFFIDFGSAPGCIVADTSNLPAAATHKIKCRINATTFYLIGVADF